MNEQPLDNPAADEKGQEKPQNFHEFIELDQDFTPAEAAEKLAEFHKTSPEAVLAAFFNLRNSKENITIKFKEGITKGYACIVMEGYDEAGEYQWNSLINKYTGQPMMHTA